MSGNGTGVRRILAREKVRLAESGVMVGCQAPATGAEPSVVFKRDSLSGRIEQIELSCGCGEVVLIDCQYDSPTPV